MNAVIERDVEYSFGATTMRGLIIADVGNIAAPTVVLVHDAFGLAGFSLHEARRYASLGYTVFAADVWGDRKQPASNHEVGPLIGSMVADRDEWLGRIDAAHRTAREQTEVNPHRIVTVGYCFGGSSALEYLRSGGEVRGVVAIHPGLDLLDEDAEWSPVSGAAVLACIGDDDPMATRVQRTGLQAALTANDLDWELDVYGGTVHAFTNPRLAASPQPTIAAYNERAATRSQDATTRFLRETLHPRTTALTSVGARNDQEES